MILISILMIRWNSWICLVCGNILPPLCMFLDINLIISWSSNDINIFPSKLTHFISNHRFAECQLSIPGPNILVKEVSYQKFKQINMDNFRSDIASSLLCNSLNSQWTSLEELAQCYDTTLSQILVKHTPVTENQDSDCKTKSVVVHFGTFSSSMILV